MHEVFPQSGLAGELKFSGNRGRYQWHILLARVEGNEGRGQGVSSAIPSVILDIHRAKHLSEGLAWSFLVSSLRSSAKNLLIHNSLTPLLRLS